MLLPGASRLLPPLCECIYDAEHERILMVFRRRPLEDIASLEGLERSLCVRPVVAVFRVERQVIVCDKLCRKRELLKILNRACRKALVIAIPFIAGNQLDL